MKQNLYNKVFDRHIVKELSPGRYQVIMGLHLIHEVTSPQAFSMLHDRNLQVAFPSRTFATVDHIVPTDGQPRPYKDSLAEEMIQALEVNTKKHNIRFFSPAKNENGIVHVIGPERGLTQPGMTICCGDSHTSTHGAFGSLAFGIGTSQIRDVLATQSLIMEKSKVRRIEVRGRLPSCVFAKDVILYIINRLGVNGGLGYAYEYAGTVFDSFTMEERMTVCNMSIEGGARCGYVNPDATTFAYLKDREFSPKGKAWDRAVQDWESLASDSTTEFDDRVVIDAEEIGPMVTWGITPAQSVIVHEQIPHLSSFPESERASIQDAFDYMKVEGGNSIAGTKIQVAFLGSCTNGRLSDFEIVVKALQSGKWHIDKSVRAIAVPGSETVRKEIIKRSWDKVLIEAGFEFREAGCSLCLAMNPDKLQGNQICASSSNRNFKGRQGSPSGRTLLMSPLMVLAAAIAGKVIDARDMFKGSF